MGNSYLLYQKYEKRGNQPFHPSYPVEYSVDGNGTMQKVLKMQNDPNCNAVDPTRYQWVIVTGDYMCSGTTKCQKEKEQRSDDFGQTWSDTGNYRAGAVIETNSVDCGWQPPQYRTVSGTPYCDVYTKMADTYNQVSYDGGTTWENTGVTGKTVIEYNSPECGYPIYQWVDTDNYICEEETPIDYGYVDLGLPSGTLWADRNVGARNVGDEGLFFRWGATKGFTSAQAEDSTFVENAPQEYNAKYEPYWGSSGLTKLRPEDDAATQNMGSEWRMPTASDWNELMSNTDLVRDNSNSPCYLRSKINGNRLSFPMAGRYFEPNVGSPNPDRDTHAYIWSSNRSVEGSSSFSYEDYPPGFEHMTNLTWTNPSRQFVYYDRRYYASSVRGIKDTPQYRTISGTPYCDGYNLVVDTQEQVSYDRGVTWNDITSGTSVVEYNSHECGYPIYQWVDTDDYVCENDGVDYENQYLTFEIISSGTIVWGHHWVESANTTISYSKNNDSTWIDITSTSLSGTSFNVNAGDKILFKGNNLSYGRKEGNTPIYNSFSGSTATFNIYGNIMSLIYGDNFQNITSLPSGSVRNFYGLFNATNVVSAENLILPATAMTDSCYYDMFNGCTSLTTAPQLPATTLANTCYRAMFGGCISLTTAPELPATDLAQGCYAAMFEGCTSLTTTPELPATTLAFACYRWMFNGCTSLTTAPELPATTLVQDCYNVMFYGCTSLNYIKCMAISHNAYHCTYQWVNGVAASGTFVKNSLSYWSTGVDGIPTGWTVQDAS